MAEALERHAYRRLNISVQSAGLTSGGADPRAVLVLSEIGIEIDADLTTSVGDVELGAFDLLVSLVIPKLNRQAHQVTLRWDDAAFATLDTSPSLRLIRAARELLLQRITALGAILSTTNRA